MDQHFVQSSYREKLVEHLFVGELLKRSWLERGCKLEIAKPDVDNGGYDLIAEEGNVVRHIQLKAARLGSTTSKQKVHVGLASKPSGCVVWIYLDDDNLTLGPYLFFGNEPGRPLPDLTEFRVAKHTKANAEGVKAERPAIREIPKGRFAKYSTSEEIYDVLFGRV